MTSIMNVTTILKTPSKHSTIATQFCHVRLRLLYMSTFFLPRGNRPEIHLSYNLNSHAHISKIPQLYHLHPWFLFTVRRTVWINAHTRFNLDPTHHHHLDLPNKVYQGTETGQTSETSDAQWLHSASLVTSVGAPSEFMTRMTFQNLGPKMPFFLFLETSRIPLIIIFWRERRLEINFFLSPSPWEILLLEEWTAVAMDDNG